MTSPTPSPNAVLEILQFLLKPITIALKPVGVWWEHKTKRKPKLHVQFRAQQTMWTLGAKGTEQMMQVMVQADITHDDSEDLILMDVYPKGTKPVVAFMHQVAIRPKEVAFNHRIVAMVAPVPVKKGEEWTGKLIFVDQFERKWKKNVTLAYVGPK